MKNIRIAIIDNGVNESLLKNPLEHKILVTNEGECIFDNDNMAQVSFMHGTICAMIIENYFPDCILSSVKVLNENGKGLLSKLHPAMEWCLQHQIQIINLSLGSTYFEDKEPIQKLINQYAMQGLLVIAANSNSEYVSYPASLSNVIGVATDSRKYNRFTYKENLGINVLAPVKQELMIQDEKIIIQQSNSYAAPYITALIGKICTNISSINIHEVIKNLQPIAKNYGIFFLPQYYEPDWIHTALVKTSKLKSKAKYYFNTVEGMTEEKMHLIDTVIIDDLSQIKEENFYNKNIVYLGNEKVKEPIRDRFFWSSQNRMKHILDSRRNEKVMELNIPTILCEWDGYMDEMYFLSELKRSFYQDGYHVYTVSFHVESVLYGLEYIPEDALKKEYEFALDYFIYRQTYCKQNAALLLGISPDIMPQSERLQEKADLRVIFEKQEYNYQVLFFYENIIKERVLLEEVGFESIQIIFQKIKEILGGNINE